MSDGPEPVEEVTVPGGLQGQDFATVEQILVELGLRPVNVGSEESQQPQGTVLRVSPGPGAVLSPGTEVDYVVSSGPPPTQAPTTPPPTAAATPAPSPTATTGP